MAAPAALDISMFMDEVGHFGKYQTLTYFVLSLSIFYSAIAALTYAFTAEYIDHRCMVPECENKTSKEFKPEWLEHTMDASFNCERYAVTTVDVSQSGKICPADWFNKTAEPIKCGNDELMFKDEDWTIMREWNITCGRGQRLALVGTLNNVGQMFGFPITGYFSDRYGRKPTLMVSTILTCLFGIGHALAWNYYSFLVLEILTAAVCTGIYNSGFVLGVEVVGKRARVIGGVTISSFYSIGFVLLAGPAWLLKNWRTLSYIYAPGFLCIFYYWCLPESVLWLQSRGKREKLVKNLLFAAKVNGHPLSEEDLNKFKKVEENPQQSTEGENAAGRGRSAMLQAFLKVFHSRILIFRLINFYYCWVTNAFVYIGLSISAVSVGNFPKYVSFMLGGVIEIPAYILTPIITEKAGRRATLSASLALSGVACAIYPLINNSTAQLVLFLVSKFCITISYAVVYVFTAELLPTDIRHTMIGTCNTVGRIGSITAPQWRVLNSYAPGLSFYLFGALSISSAFFILLLPETSNLKLPSTVEEAEQIGKGSRNIFMMCRKKE